VSAQESSWGIEPVPQRLRVLGTVNTGLFWGNLGVSLLVIVAAAALVPALSLPDALLAIVVGAVIGQVMLSAAAGIGAQARVPTMVLMRAPLGRRGSTLPTAVNVVQTLGWTVFELLVIATAAAALSDHLLGFRAQWAWTLVFGGVALVFGLVGPIGVVRRFVRTVAVWAVPLAVAYLIWWALDGADLTRLWHKPGEGGLTVWQGADIVVGITVSWIPLVADYTRFSRNGRSAFWGTGIGYLLPNVGMLALGAVIVLSRSIFDAGALPAAVAAGGGAAFLALLALTAGETDDAFANAYSAAVSLQNLVPALPLRLLVTLTTVAGTIGALVIDLASYQTFLLLLGSFFVPLFAVLLADWLRSGGTYDRADIFEAPAWRVTPIVAWLAGFVVYWWLNPHGGPGWWGDIVEHLNPPEWSIGATLPSFAVSFVLGGAAAMLAPPGVRVRPEV
jgi:putative hydroxymethylpyrimidine transporter CytX